MRRKVVLRLTDIYYGWMIVAVALVSMAFWFGIRSSFSVFYVALLEDFPWTRGETAGIQSVVLLTYTAMAPIVGGFIDRFGPRSVIAPGILLLALGLAVCSSIKSLAGFYLLYGILMAMGAASIGIVAYTAILAHWFDRKRGLASGIAVSGMGLGTFLLVPFSQYFISGWGWRYAFLGLGGLVLVVLFPLNALLLRHKPQDMGLFPDGMSQGKLRSRKGPKAPHPVWSETDWTLGKALRTGRFWALLIFAFLIVIAVYALLVHHVSFLVDSGIGKMKAAFAFAAIGIISSGFRIFWGWISDRIGREVTSTIGAMCVAGAACSLLLLETMGEKNFLYLFIVFFGAGWGVTAPMFMAVAADLFRGKGFGLIYGILESVIGVGGALGAWVAGFIFDRTGTYQSALGLAISVSVVSCLFVWLAAPRKARQVEG